LPQWKFYQPTELEKEVVTLYRSIGIEKPSDIDEELIASRLGGRYFALDKTLPALQQARAYVR
jgi:hypothetical protein